jgi:uncharacterized phage protein gp47/JayE
MATLAPQITSTGIVAPTYADILAELQNFYWSIYGSDADLSSDSQDGQFLSILAQIIYDTNMVLVTAYNGFSPTYAQGAGLSSLVKINGIARLVPSNSQAVVELVGQAGTTISNGQIGDNLGLNTKWNLPALVVIPLTGSIEVTATCTTAGATPAAANSLTQILTPTRGWQTVNNPAAAEPGLPVESDATLRQRQAASTALPAQTTLEAITAAIANITGVGRLIVYENDGDAPDGNGIPAHSISAVVQGGDVQQIASAIASKKSPGTGTYGTTVVIVTDTNGVPDTIRFYELTNVDMHIEVDLTALQGFVSTTEDAMKAAIAAFINGLAIGEDSYINRLFSPANLGGTGLGATFNITAIRQARGNNVPAAADVVIDFNEAAVCDVANITLNVT